jgi:hypothetical protein
MGRRLLPSGRCVIPSGRCSLKGKTCIQSSTIRTAVFMVRTIKLHIWKLRAPVQPSGRQPSGSGRSKPYYGNYVQPKCNRPDARATPSGCGLVMEAFSAILERRLQLTVRTLGQAARTPSGILVITFYSNIGLGQNLRRWKAKKKFCNLSIQTYINSVRTEIFSGPDSPAENSIITFRTRKTWPVQTALAPVLTRVPQNPFLTQFWVSKAYK